MRPFVKASPYHEGQAEDEVNLIPIQGYCLKINETFSLYSYGLLIQSYEETKFLCYSTKYFSRFVFFSYHSINILTLILKLPFLKNCLLKWMGMIISSNSIGFKRF